MKKFFKILFANFDAKSSKTFSPSLSKKLMYLKAVLFLVIGIFGFLYCWLTNFNLTFFSMLVLTIWAWSRLYYFVFYVITNYIDSKYKFSGIMDFVYYLFKKK
jgi:hypothetical protein